MKEGDTFPPSSLSEARGRIAPLAPPSATPCYAGTKKDEGLRGFSNYVKERSRR
jgi:hypothetical protein